MPVNADKLKELIKQHNDPNSNVMINTIMGTSSANFFPIRMKKDDQIIINDGEIIWKEYVEEFDSPIISKTGIENIDLVNYIEFSKTKKELKKLEEEK